MNAVLGFGALQLLMWSSEAAAECWAVLRRLSSSSKLSQEHIGSEIPCREARRCGRVQKSCQPGARPHSYDSVDRVPSDSLSVLQEVGREVHALVAAAAELALTSPDTVSLVQQAQQALEALMQSWDGCSQLLGSGTGAAGCFGEDLQSPDAQVARQLAALQGLAQVVGAAQGMASQLGPPADELASRATKLAARVQQLHGAVQAADAAAAGKFEWVDGALTRCDA